MQIPVLVEPVANNGFRARSGEPLPLCPVPLLPPDADVPLSLGEVLAQVYQRAAYARRIDYALPVPPPPLRPAMQRWLAAHLVPLRSK